MDPLHMVCDGCNVRDGWEHRCHTPNGFPGPVTIRGERFFLRCDCSDCADMRRFVEEQRKAREARP